MLTCLSVQKAIPCVRPGKSREILGPSVGTNDTVFRTDSPVDTAFLFALKVVQHIPAQNIKVGTPGYLVPEVFQLNGCVCLPLRP